MSETVYILEGYSGRFDDYGSWLVAAYLSEREAEWHKAAIEELIAGSHGDLAQAIRASGLDEKASVIDGEIFYHVIALPLPEKAPRPKHAVEITPGARSRDSALAERSAR